LLSRAEQYEMPITKKSYEERLRILDLTTLEKKTTERGPN